MRAFLFALSVVLLAGCDRLQSAKLGAYMTGGPVAFEPTFPIQY